jgi:hypothetical protein
LRTLVYAAGPGHGRTSAEVVALAVVHLPPRSAEVNRGSHGGSGSGNHSGRPRGGSLLTHARVGDAAGVIVPLAAAVHLGTVFVILVIVGLVGIPVPEV